MFTTLTQPMTRTYPKTVNRSQLAIALGFQRSDNSISWAAFYNHLEHVLGENWKRDFKIQESQRLFTVVQTEKIIQALELKPYHFQ
jgi:hypothetical protein